MVNDFQKEKEEKEVYDNYKKYIVKLEDGYLYTFKKVEMYISSSTKLNVTEKNNCFLQVLDTFLSAQTQGKSIEDITGTNIKKYCDNMIYGEGLGIGKSVKILYAIIGLIFYIEYMQFFTRIFAEVIFGEKRTIYEPITFGLGEIILGLSCICIPILKSKITKKHFENPKRCKRLNIVIYNVMWLIGLFIYTFMEQKFGRYGLTISFTTIIVILIYLAIIRAAVWLLVDRTSNIKYEEKMKLKYNEKLEKDYIKHKIKCDNKNKEPKTWNEFLIKKGHSEKVKKIIVFIYAVIYFTAIIFIGYVMISNEEIDIILIILLVILSFLEVVFIGIIKGDKLLKGEVYYK